MKGRQEAKQQDTYGKRTLEPRSLLKRSAVAVVETAQASVYPLRAKLAPRRCHAFCIGTAKSGTHSLAGIFGEHYRSAHEPKSEALIQDVLAYRSGWLSEPRLRNRLLRRDRVLYLEMNSSQVNLYVLHLLVQTFADAQFVLTIRDPWSWLDSLFNHYLTRQATPVWQAFRELRFGPRPVSYPDQEHVLKEYGLYPLRNYLSYWCFHNQTVLASVPRERLCLIRTHEISRSAENLAAFLDLPASTLNMENSHLYQAQARRGILGLIDSDYLVSVVSACCGALVSRLFPDFI